MVQVTVSVDFGPTLQNLSSDKVNEVKYKGLDYASQEMVRVLMQNTSDGDPRVIHGVLKSWFVESLTEDEAHIKSQAKYARWVNDGHPQQPGRYIPGTWNGDIFEYDPKSKTGMVLKADYVEGRHFVEDSIDDVQGRLDGYFLKALSEVLG